MANNRIIFISEQPLIAPGVGFSAFSSTHVVHGAQSIGMNGNIPITSIYELGQAQPYEQMEEVSDFTVSMDKDLDGYPLLWHKSTYDASTPDLLGRSDSRCHLGLVIFPDTQQYASGTGSFACYMSGYYPSNLSITIPNQGACTESMSWVGNDRKWYSQNYRLAEAGTLNILSGFFTGGAFTIPDSPAAASGIMRREDVLFNYSTTLQGTDSNGCPVYASGTVLPRQIPGMNSSGQNIDIGGGVRCDYSVKLQSIRFSVGLQRQDIYQLGCKFPYFRSLNPTVDVNTEIEILATSGDFIEALQTGLYSTGDNTQNESIRVALRDGTRISAGTKNRLASFNVGGGGTGGENMTVTYSYNNKNNFSVLAPSDPKFGANVVGFSISGGTGSGSYWN